MTNQFCSTCGRDVQLAANFCSGCGAVVAVRPVMVRPRLVRPRYPRMVAGVCSGLALTYGWDLPLVRILFAVFTLLTSGFGLIVYLIAWVVVPEAQYALAGATVQQGSTV